MKMKMNVLRFAGVEFRSLLDVRTGVEMKGAGILIILPRVGRHVG